MRVQPALVDGERPLGGNAIVNGRRVDEVYPAYAPLGQIRSEQRDQNEIALQLDDRMSERLDIVDADGLVRLVNRHVVKNRLVNRALVVGREILRWDRIAAQE